MSLRASEFTVNPNKDFTRKKKWDFATLMKFIISMESQSLKNELHKYFGYTTDCPSTASFNQRRAQIRAEAFCDMVDRYGGMLKTVFIVDRGYESYNNLAHVQEKGAFYLFRCKDLNSSDILSGLKHKLPSTEQFDCNISINLTRRENISLKKYGQDLFYTIFAR